MDLLMKLQEIQKEFTVIERSFSVAKCEVLISHEDVCKSLSTSTERIGAVQKYESRLFTFKVLQEKLNKKSDEFAKAIADIAKAAEKARNHMGKISDDIDDLQIPTVSNGNKNKKSLMKRPSAFSSPAQQPPSKKAATDLPKLTPQIKDDEKTVGTISNIPKPDEPEKKKTEVEDGFNDEWPESFGSEIVRNVDLQKNGKKEESPTENEPAESKNDGTVVAEKEE